MDDRDDRWSAFAVGRVAFARQPPRRRRWFAHRSDGMSLGNTSLFGALRFLVVEMARGYTVTIERGHRTLR